MVRVFLPVAVVLLSSLFYLALDGESRKHSEAFEFDAMQIEHPTKAYVYDKVCMDGIEYYRMGRGAAPVVDKETLTFKRCSETNDVLSQTN
ncbi:hypothetical protein VPHK567_0047 [Vibrio phage K567]